MVYRPRADLLHSQDDRIAGSARMEAAAMLAGWNHNLRRLAARDACLAGGGLGRCAFPRSIYAPVRRHISFGITQQFRIHL